MKILLASLLFPLFLHAQNGSTATLRTILLEQLRTTHNQKDWFVPIGGSLAGLTPEQASWTSGKGNHSIGQIAQHLLFWNQQNLNSFLGKPSDSSKVVNDETFNSFNRANWAQLKKQLDDVMTAWEKAVQAADEKKLAAGASTIAHIGTHNAYHVGQILYIRKLQGSWDPKEGVK